MTVHDLVEMITLLDSQEFEDVTVPRWIHGDRDACDCLRCEAMVAAIKLLE